MTFKNIIQRMPGKEFETRAGVCCGPDCGKSGADGGF